MCLNDGMKKEDLIQVRDSIKQQFDNLSNPNWVSLELQHLKGKYEILSEVIESIEKEESDAASKENKQTNSGKRSGK